MEEFAGNAGLKKKQTAKNNYAVCFSLQKNCLFFDIEKQFV